MPHPVLRRLRRHTRNLHGDAGTATAEYAVVTVAAVAFGGILWKVVTSEEIQQTLANIITEALK